jgi:hypothetical protein
MYIGSVAGMMGTVHIIIEAKGVSIGSVTGGYKQCCKQSGCYVSFSIINFLLLKLLFLISFGCL